MDEKKQWKTKMTKLTYAFFSLTIVLTACKTAPDKIQSEYQLQPYWQKLRVAVAAIDLDGNVGCSRFSVLFSQMQAKA